MSKTKDPSPKTNEVAAILLAAGRSRRMGAFKPLLPFGDKTVVERCVTNLSLVGIRQIVVVVGHRAAEVRRQLKNFEVSFAMNPDPNSEMSASIACGVEQLSREAKAVLIALVDHPAVPVKVIKLVIDEWRRNEGLLIQPTHEGRGGHPVLTDLAYRDELLDLDPQRGLRSLFEHHRDRVRRLAVDSPYVAWDMDTWEDYRRLHQEVFRVLPEDT